MKKLYSDDELIHYKDTEVGILRTRSAIDSVLAEYGIYQTAWNWRPELNDIWIIFNITEVINDVPVKVSAKVVCNIIWDRANPKAKNPENRLEKPNLKLSMRQMYWYIKTHLEASYAMQSSNVSAFLPNLMNTENKTVEQVLIPKLVQDQQYALPFKEEDQWTKPEVKQIQQEPKAIR